MYYPMRMSAVLICITAILIAFLITVYIHVKQTLRPYTTG